MTTDEILHRFEGGELWFKCASDESYVIRTENGSEKHFIKFKGEPEFEAQTGSSILLDAYLQIEFITKDQYEKF